MENLLGMTLADLSVPALEAGLPPYAARQMAEWLYSKNVPDINSMTNISKKGREKLSERYFIERKAPVAEHQSSDGTKKYLFIAGEGRFIEAAYIPDRERATLCLSSQAGCRMGCLFCMTGKQGFQGNLSPGEIINQIVTLPEREKLTNIVYMGMGEPLDNTDNVLKSIEIITSSWGLGMSPRRITVSTIGIIPAMRQFLEKSDAHLAVSMHSPFEEERKMLMPVEKVYPIKEVLKTIREYDLGRQRRISFEYIMFRGINDSERHIKELKRLLNGLRCRINLIRFHAIPGVSLESSGDKTIVSFRDGLTASGITTTIRASRGEDIMAACGLLSTKEMAGRNSRNT